MAKKQLPKVIIFLQKIKLYILQKYSYSALVRNHLNMNINVLMHFNNKLNDQGKCFR